MKPFPSSCFPALGFVFVLFALGCARPEERLQRGLDALRSGESKSAIKELDAAAKKLPPSGSIQYNRGVALYRLGRMEEAAKAFEASLTLEPDEGDTLLFLGHARLALEQWPEARDAFRKAAQIADDPTESFLAMSLAEVGAGRPDVARLRILQALRNQPDNPVAYFNLGQLYRRNMHMPDKALDQFTKFLALAPPNDPRRSVAAEAIELLRASGVGQSTAPSPDSLLREPGRARLEYEAAVKARKNNKIREACAGFSRALRADPLHFEAAQGLGRAYRDLNDPAPAIQAFQQAVNIRPDDASALYDLALILYSSADYDQASQTLDAAITEHPRDAKFFQLMSYVRVRQGRMEEAHDYGEYFIAIAEPSAERDTFADWLRSF
ncbi:MAG: tetratricopeptide repeat protein [Kiritimatiellia bacterium]|jgi:tetratricopeptide (TPR) repeat protein